MSVMGLAFGGCSSIVGVVSTAGLRAIASDAVIDRAYAWLCARRKDAPADADVWHLRFHWASERPRLVAALLAGRYRFAPVRVWQSAAGQGTR